MEKQFVIIGNEPRQQAAAQVLAEAGFRLAGEDRIGQGDYLLLPMSPHPAQLALLSQARPDAVAFGGRIPAGDHPIPVIDYYRRDELIRLNAVPTAEGCIQLLLYHSRRTLWNSQVLVLGFGRVGQAVALRCKALGAAVTVAARSPEARAWAETLDLAAVSLEESETLLPKFHRVVNTIPAPVLNRAQMALLPKACLIVDLASSPGGTDLSAAGELGIQAVFAPGLPGKCAPETAGAMIGRTVLNILRERGEQL